MTKPVVLFIVPDKYTQAYSALMYKLATQSLISNGKDPDSVDLVGYVSPNAEYGAACLHFLGRSGIEPHNVLALVLFGEAGDQFSFSSSGTDDYVLGSVIVPGSLVSYPTLCVPSLDTEWITDSAHWERIRDRFAALLQNGRKELHNKESYTFITRNKANWN